MHHIKKYIQKIVDDGDIKEMEDLSDILDEVIINIYNYDEKIAKKYEMELYRMAYGDILSKEMAEEIISKMRPYGERWSIEETRRIQEQYGLDHIREVDFWVVMNQGYNDFRDIFEDNIDLYVKYTRDFIEDEDAKEGKVFIYFVHIPR